MNLRVALLLAALLAAGAVAAKSFSSPVLPASTVAQAWQRLARSEDAPHASGNGCGDDLLFDYGKAGGMRNFFCRTLTFFSWKTFVALAPVTPFRAGPHKAGKLNLKSQRDFGRYNPKFVRWAVDTLVPGASDTQLRAVTQGAYDFQMRNLARTYFEVWRAVASDKSWLAKEVVVYLRAADDKSVAWDSEVSWFYHDVLGSSDSNWGGHDPNLVRSATMFWLRREKDGTAALWLEGLEKLLGAYDKPWLDGQKATPFSGVLPQRQTPNPPPDYR